MDLTKHLEKNLMLNLSFSGKVIVNNKPLLISYIKILNNKKYIKHLSHLLENNKEVVLACVSIDPFCIDYASDKIRDDKNFCYESC